jgi:hypothetical protein
VLQDVDSSLLAWLAAELPGPPEIRFEPPGEFAGRSRPVTTVLSVFLYDIAEELAGQASTGTRIRDDRGRAVGTMNPARNYRLNYLVTAWGATVFEEHALLGAVIGAHAEQDSLPLHHLRGSLAVISEGLPLRIGRHENGRPDGDLWAALGVGLRTAVELTVTAPALPTRIAEPAPPVERLELGVHHDRAPRRRWDRRTITDATPTE